MNQKIQFYKKKLKIKIYKMKFKDYKINLINKKLLNKLIQIKNKN